MAVADLEKGGFGFPRSPKERSDSRMKNYIGEDTVLKSGSTPLVLMNE